MLDLKYYLKFTAIVPEVLELDLEDTRLYNLVELSRLQAEYCFLDSAIKQNNPAIVDDKELLKIIKKARKNNYKVIIDGLKVKVLNRSKKVIFSKNFDLLDQENNSGNPGLFRQGEILPEESTKAKRSEPIYQNPVYDYKEFFLHPKSKISFIVLKLPTGDYFNCLEFQDYYIGYKEYLNCVLPYCIISKKSLKVLQYWDNYKDIYTDYLFTELLME